PVPDACDVEATQRLYLDVDLATFRDGAELDRFGAVLLQRHERIDHAVSVVADRRIARLQVKQLQLRQSVGHHERVLRRGGASSGLPYFWKRSFRASPRSSCTLVRCSSPS